MILNTIEKAGYKVTTEQVETLANHVAHGRRADGCYLRIMVVAMQTVLGAKKRSKAGQLSTLATVHDEFYPAVLRGVGPSNLETHERNRRATFARTAKSTLRTFIKGGGDVRTLEAATVTKAALRDAFAPQVPAGTRLQRIFRASQERLLRALKRMPLSEARHALNGVLEALQGVELVPPSGAKPPGISARVSKSKSTGNDARLN